MKHNYVAIMAGGAGTRFWPASNEDKPKQFLDILGIGKSLLQLTYERFSGFFPDNNIFVVTNKKYKDLVLKQLPLLDEDHLILEPTRNNTAPSVAYTAFKLNARDPEANIVMAPSDHFIRKEQLFLEKISGALHFASGNDALITLGITPTRPDTGYGYIEKGEQVKDAGLEIYKVLSFREKPDVETAKKYLESGNYLWNAGIFIWKSATIIKAFEKYAPGIYNIFLKGNAVYNTPAEKDFIEKNYPLTTKISVDFAIMEKADNIYTIPADIDWSDLGTWKSLHSFLDKDSNKNAVINKNATLIDSHDNIIKLPKEKKAIIKGLDDFIVIDENGVLLIYPKDKEQEIKTLDKK